MAYNSQPVAGVGFRHTILFKDEGLATGLNRAATIKYILFAKGLGKKAVIHFLLLLHKGTGKGTGYAIHFKVYF